MTIRGRSAGTPYVEVPLSRGTSVWGVSYMAVRLYIEISLYTGRPLYWGTRIWGSHRDPNPFKYTYHKL